MVTVHTPDATVGPQGPIDVDATATRVSSATTAG